MSESAAHEPKLLHQFKNQLSIVLGFCDLLLAEMPRSDERYADIREIHKAAHAAMDLVPELAKRMR